MKKHWLRAFLATSLAVTLTSPLALPAVSATDQSSTPPTAKDKNVFGEATVVYGNDDAGYLQIPFRFTPVEGDSDTEQSYHFRDEYTGEEIIWGIRDAKAPTKDQIPEDFQDMSPVVWIGYLNLREAITKGGVDVIGEYAQANGLEFYHLSSTLPDHAEIQFYYLMPNNPEEVILLYIKGANRSDLDRLLPIMRTWSPTEYE